MITLSNNPSCAGAKLKPTTFLTRHAPISRPSPRRSPSVVFSFFHHPPHHHHHHCSLFVSPPATTLSISQNFRSNAPPLSHKHSPKPRRLRLLTCSRRSLSEAFLSLNNTSASCSDFPSSPESYSSVLELCASQTALRQGQQLHARILTTGSIGDDGFLETKLLFMYGKCGSLSVARKLFDAMSHRSVFAWNALIGAYASNGRYMDAVKVYQEMWASGTIPDACTFASVLKACAALEDHDCGTEVHGVGIKCGAVSAIFVVNALLTMYAKCGKYEQARQLFDWIHEKTDVVSWNSIMSAYLQKGDCLEALGLFREMQRTGIGMNSYTVVAVLQACTELAHLKLGQEIHAAVLKLGQGFQIFEANALLVMYARCGQMDNAIWVFNEMPEKDNVSWNSMLSGFVQNELYYEAIEFFFEMQDMHFKPDQVSVISIASALGRLHNLMSGLEIHAYAVKRDFDSDLQVGNTLMDMYTKCSCLDYAEHVFHRMPNKDFISWTTAIAGYAQKGCHLKAFDLFREVQREGMKVDSLMIGSILIACSGLPSIEPLKQLHGYAVRHGLFDLLLENSIIDVYGVCGEVRYAFQVFERIENKDVVSWTSMINCYVQNGLLNEAFDLFYDMEKANVEPDRVAICNILAAAAELASLKIGKEIHAFLVRKGFGMDTSVGIALVDMYARSGSLDSCFKIFDVVEHRDLLLWTAIINACGMHGQGEEAIGRFISMLDAGLVPDHVAFMSLLYACGHSGLADEGKRYLDIMQNKYKLEPWPEHYACIVDALGRSGRIEEAFEFINSMPLGPTATLWCALLGACRVHSNNEIGEVAARRLLELQPENPGNYVLISNVFAAAGKWDDAEEVRKRMKEMGLRKDPACSWIQIGNKVHSFIARDRSHPESEGIYSKLNEIKEQLKMHAGYVGDSRFVLHDVGEEEKLKMLYGHSERLAIAYGLMSTRDRTPIRITKNLRVCGDCHEFTKLVSKFFERQIIVRDTNRFHHFKDGFCSCGDFW